jgi:hypothetical protein
MPSHSTKATVALVLSVVAVLFCPALYFAEYVALVGVAKVSSEASTPSSITAALIAVLIWTRPPVFRPAHHRPIHRVSCATRSQEFTRIDAGQSDVASSHRHFGRRHLRPRPWPALHFRQRRGGLQSGRMLLTRGDSAGVHHAAVWCYPPGFLTRMRPVALRR